MMDIDELLLLRRKFTRQDIKYLEGLLMKYPWFSAGHQLLYLALKQTNDPHAGEQLKQASVHTLNRKRLYKFSEQVSAFSFDDERPEDNFKAYNQQPAVTEGDDLLLNFSNTYFTNDEITQAPESETENIDSLIDKFIASNPRIIPKLINIDSETEDWSTKNKEVNDDLVSETLAEIYASQGLIDMAIASYEKLILQNPEKSAYFASLIEDLKGRKK